MIPAVCDCVNISIHIVLMVNCTFCLALCLPLRVWAAGFGLITARLSGHIRSLSAGALTRMSPELFFLLKLNFNFIWFRLSTSLFNQIFKLVTTDER